MNTVFLHGVSRPATHRGFALAILATIAGLLMPLVPTTAADATTTMTGSAVDFPVGVSMGNRLFTMTPAQRATALDQIRDMGATWVRVDMDWGSMQPGPKTWNLNPMDEVVTQANARGLNILGIIAYTPKWARLASCADYFACPPQSPSAFAKFARTLAKRYEDKVQAFEIWNEPNYDLFWPEIDPELYGRLFDAASTEIRRVNSGVEILFGALAAMDTNEHFLDAASFLRRACQLDRCAEATAVSYHPYTFPRMATDQSTPSTTWQRMLPTYGASDSMYEAARSVGLDVPFWVTEFGAPTGGRIENVDHVSEARQAEIALSGLAAAREDREHVAGLFYYTLNDLSQYGDNEDHFGLVRTDNSLKPAYTALQDALR